MTFEQGDEVRIRRHRGLPDCDVIVSVRQQEILIKCRDYNQAVKWARLECKSYKIDNGFTVED